MSLTSEQIAELQAKAAQAEELQRRLGALDDKKAEILDEKKQLQERLKKFEDQEKERAKKELEDQGRTAELLEHERKQVEELQKQLQEKDEAIEQERQQRVKDRVRADFGAVFNAGEVFHPDHAWALLHPLVQDEDGKTTASFKGQKVAVAELAAKLRQDPQYAYLFRPRGAGGMGSRPAGGEPVGMSGNPYLPGGNLTSRIALELENPDLAAKLKEAADAAGKG